MTLTLPAITEQVRAMYTDFPYPPPGAVEGLPVSAVMDYTRYIFWPGRPDLAGLRVLDAGCGTGNTAARLAAAHPELEVVGIDLSKTSLRHARRLAQKLGVRKNLQLECLSVEEVGSLGQKFDYIISSGVLHHLDSPVRGLRALKDVLKPTGGIFLMLYATYGRTGVYMLQEALRTLGGDASFADRAALARAVVANLPSDHPFDRARFSETMWNDDAGIVDLLLHVRDRSYTVPQIYDLLDAADLRLARFMDPAAYEPANYMSDPTMAAALSALDPRRRAHMAELLRGTMSKHQFYATHAAYQPPAVKPSGMVLFALRPRCSPLFAWDQVTEHTVDGEKRLRLEEQPISDAYRRSLDLPTWSLPILKRCDGRMTAFEVFSLPAVQAALPGNADEKLQVFGGLIEHLGEHEVLLCEP